MNNCTIIKIKTTDQRLLIVQQPILASGDVGTVLVEYEVDSPWDGYTLCGTFYRNSAPKDVYESTLVDGACVVPWEVLQEDGVLYIGLRGADDNGRVKTAASVRYKIERGSPAGTAEIGDPPPGLYQQLLERVQSAEETSLVNQIISERDGDSFVIQDSAAAGIHGLRVFGKTRQKTTTGAQLAGFPSMLDVTENGVTWSCKYGAITAKGTPRGTARSNAVGIFAEVPIVAGTYYISGDSDNVDVVAKITYTNGTFTTKINTDFTLDGSESTCIIYCEVGGTNTVNETIRPMLNKGSEPLPWELYTGGVAASAGTPDYPLPLDTIGAGGSIEVSLDDQRLDVSTPNGLPGIRLTLASSVENYTDSEGQRWVCDEIDFERGVYIQRIGRKIFDGSEEIKPSSAGSYYIPVSSITSSAVKSKVDCFCSCLLGTPAEAVDGGKNNVVSMTGTNLWFRANAYPTPADFQGRLTYLASEEVNKPMELLYQLAAPIETPLSEEQLAAYRELHTNKPTTAVSSDEEVWLSVKYAADPKAYIDNKFNELAAAIITHT